MPASAEREEEAGAEHDVGDDAGERKAHRALGVLPRKEWRRENAHEHESRHAPAIVEERVGSGAGVSVGATQGPADTRSGAQ